MKKSINDLQFGIKLGYDWSTTMSWLALFSADSIPELKSLDWNGTENHANKIFCKPLICTDSRP